MRNVLNAVVANKTMSRTGRPQRNSEEIDYVQKTKKNEIKMNVELFLVCMTK